eukprot:971413-Prorocentrum_minimum.AAC.1
MVFLGRRLVRGPPCSPAGVSVFVLNVPSALMENRIVSFGEVAMALREHALSMVVASYGGFSQKDLPDHSLPGLWASSERDHPP